jgi:VanZ family protein
MLATVATLTLMPDPPNIESVLMSSDKMLHFLAYMVLMWWFVMAWRGRREWAWGAMLVAAGIVLEWLQGIMGTRLMEAGDMVANAIGVGLGWLLCRTPLARTLSWVEARLGGL